MNTQSIGRGKGDLEKQTMQLRPAEKLKKNQKLTTETLAWHFGHVIKMPLCNW